ncbi:MAG: glycosyltransferase family 4 protein [bacterium]
MKIIFIRRRWTATGGAENYLTRLAHACKKRGHSTILVCESWVNSEKTGDSFDEIVPLSFQAPRFSRPMEFARHANAFLSDIKRDCVLSLERGVYADIYRAGDGVHLAWLQRRRKFHPLRGFFQNHFNLKNRIVCDLEKKTFTEAGARRILANSNMIKEDILAHFDYPEEKIEVIHNGVDFEYFSSGNRNEGRKALGIEEKELIFLLVGAGAERKGHAYARRIVKNIRRSMPARLLIVDKPPPCPMPHVYAAADVFLLPTLYDPFANVTLEAMAAGLPVITTKDNGAAELIESGKNGFVANSASEVEKMATYGKAFAHASFRHEIGAAAQTTARAHAFSSHVEQVIQFCEQVVM